MSSTGTAAQQRLRADAQERPQAIAQQRPQADKGQRPGADARRRQLEAARDAIVSCQRCPRLRDYCTSIALTKKRAHAQEVYWGRPVPGFGDPCAHLLVLGLAPAAHGANRTGRVFTGDGSGDFLMRAMHEAGFASIPTSRAADDGLALQDAWIASAVRCAPPDNKPLPQEIRACQGHLDAEWNALAHVQVIVALGRIGFDAALALLARQGVIVRPKPVFAHGAATVAGSVHLLASYHPSRQNTNTGRLTAPMLAAIFHDARARLIASSGSR